MKKVILTVLAVLLATTCVFASGAQENAEQLELVIYSAGSEAECQAVVDRFNEYYPNVKCTILQGSSGDLVTRVSTEWPSPMGDVIFLMASENLSQIYDYLDSYKTVNDARLGAEYKDANYKYYAASMPLQAIMYNTDILKPEEAPKSWADLANPKYKGMIELCSPASSGSAYAQLYQMYCLSGKNLDLAKRVAANGTVFCTSSTKGPTDVARGEYAITVTGEANIQKSIAAGDPVAYVHPAEGTGFRIEGCGILANCKNEKAAQYFMDFMTSEEGFEVLAEQGRRPVSSEITPEYLPALKDLKFYEYNDQEAKNLKKTLNNEFSKYI